MSSGSVFDDGVRCLLEEGRQLMAEADGGTGERREGFNHEVFDGIVRTMVN